MAQATVELRNLLKTDFELFDFEYTFDDREYAKQIEQAIIDYYYFEEIGQETPERFKHVFKTRFTKLIGYYNKLYNTTLLEYNPLINYSMSEALERLSNTESRSQSETGSTEESTQTDRGTQNRTGNERQSGSTSDTRTDRTNSDSSTRESSQGTTNTNTTGTGNTLDSDYPQNAINGDFRSGEQEQVTESETRATNQGNSSINQDSTSQTQSTAEGDSEQSTNRTEYTTDNSNTEAERRGSQNTTNTSDGEQIETYEKTIEGLTGRTYQELVQLERENLLRITSMIIAELKPCFMLTY